MTLLISAKTASHNENTLQIQSPFICVFICRFACECKWSVSVDSDCLSSLWDKHSITSISLLSGTVTNSNIISLDPRFFSNAQWQMQKSHRHLDRRGVNTLQLDKQTSPSLKAEDHKDLTHVNSQQPGSRLWFKCFQTFHTRGPQCTTTGPLFDKDSSRQYLIWLESVLLMDIYEIKIQSKHDSRTGRSRKWKCCEHNSFDSVSSNRVAHAALSIVKLNKLARELHEGRCSFPL